MSILKDKFLHWSFLSGGERPVLSGKTSSKKRRDYRLEGTVFIKTCLALVTWESVFQNLGQLVLVVVLHVTWPVPLCCEHRNKMALWHSEANNERKGWRRTFYGKRKDVLCSFLVFSTLDINYTYLNHHCEPVPHHVSIPSVLDSAEGI